ncbi:CcdB family protein [Serratia sp. D1N4]|jgi:toxin CcdB
MQQFTLYENRGNNRINYPYFIDIQNDLLSQLDSRIVLPLVELANFRDKFPANLCPKVRVDGEVFIILTHQLTTVPIKSLTHPAGSLVEYRNTIISALDFLITGI